MNINVQMNPGFKEVDRSCKRYIVMKGSAGSGKSVDTAQNYILRLMQDPGRNLLCVRKADVTNRDIAMKYKLQAMSNLEKTKERKFTSGMNRRYRLIFSNPVSGMKKDDWVKIHPHFTPNFPANLQEEAEIAKNLEGVVSQETQLGVLSIVDNAQDEIKKIDADQDKMRADLVMEQMFGGGGQDDE